MSLGYRNKIALVTLKLKSQLNVTTHYQPEPVNMRGKVINFAKARTNGRKGRDTHPRLKK
jgi:hypothetical protein